MAKQDDDGYVLSRGDVSHLLRLSPERIRQLGRDGVLPNRQTRLGRLYNAAAVEAYAVERERLRVEASHA